MYNKKEYETSFDTITFNNRWIENKLSRESDYTILGISKWFASWHCYCYKLCFFGFEIKIWFERYYK